MKRDISKLNHVELFALWEAVRTARDTLDDINGQGRFRDEAANDPQGVVTWNGAGDIVDDLARELGQFADTIADRARTLPATTDRNRRHRLELLICDEISVFECTIEEAERAFNLIDSQREGAPS
jgi:hypothetical protein